MLQYSAKHIFGKKKRKSKDWSNDQDEEIKRLLKDKKVRGNKNELRNEVRKLKNRWYQQKALQSEQYAGTKKLQ